jgi:hypothetical protein
MGGERRTGSTQREITLDQQRAIIALLEQPNVTATAREVGLDKSTLYKWLKRDDFKVAYREAKRESMGRATSRLQKAAEEAVTALQEITNDKHVQPAARVGAAKIILDKAQDA